MLAVAMRDPRTPRLARVIGVCVVAYALSPLDLIPDPIPILGFLDDLVLLPLGIWFVLKMIPTEVMAESREKVGDLPPSRAATVVAVAVVVIWILTLGLLIWIVYSALN